MSTPVRSLTVCSSVCPKTIAANVKDKNQTRARLLFVCPAEKIKQGIFVRRTFQLRKHHSSSQAFQRNV